MYRRRDDAPDDWTALLWPDADVGPWLLRIMWAEVGGRIECVGMEIRSYRENGEQWPAELPSWDEQPPVLTASTLRELRFAEVVTDLRREIAGESHDFATWAGRQPEIDDAEADSMRRLAATWSERSNAADQHAAVAEVYRKAWSDGDPPTKAVQDAFVISYSAAAKRVSRARAAGFLPETKQGRPRASQGGTDGE